VRDSPPYWSDDSGFHQVQSWLLTTCDRQHVSR
jgi:hypothetical protein